MYMRMLEKVLAPTVVRKLPETFCLTLTMRRSRSAWLLSNGMLKSYMKARTADL